MTVLNLPKLLTPKETAEFLGTTPDVLAQARAHKRPGWPPAIKVGRLVRYRLDHLEQWLERQAVTVDANEGK